MCSIVVGIGVGWGISIVGMAVGTSSEEIRWGGNELCGSRVRMGKMSAGRGGDGYEISHQCFCTDGLRFRITPPPCVCTAHVASVTDIYCSTLQSYSSPRPLSGVWAQRHGLRLSVSLSLRLSTWKTKNDLVHAGVGTIWSPKGQGQGRSDRKQYCRVRRGHI